MSVLLTDGRRREQVRQRRLTGNAGHAYFARNFASKNVAAEVPSAAAVCVANIMEVLEVQSRLVIDKRQTRNVKTANRLRCSGFSDSGSRPRVRSPTGHERPLAHTIASSVKRRGDARTPRHSSCLDGVGGRAASLIPELASDGGAVLHSVGAHGKRTGTRQRLCASAKIGGGPCTS
jgi:hypothetical protein